MRIAFRTDSSRVLGSGHATRCIALADEIAIRGFEVSFVMRHCRADTQALLEGRNFQVIKLDGAAGDQRLDAQQTAAAISPADVIVVDHYRLGKQWEHVLAEFCDTVIALDDLAREHAVDVLVDSTYPGTSSRYEGLSNVRLLLGPKFSLMASGYREAARRRGGRSKNTTGRILVSLGSGDAYELTEMVLHVLSQSEFHALEVDFVVDLSNPESQSLEQMVARTARFHLVPAPTDLAALFESADLSITAGGVSLLQRLCVGTPGIAICSSDNQWASVRALFDAGLTSYIDCRVEKYPGLLHQRLSSLLSAPRELDSMSALGRATVDGLGARRVAEVILPSAKSDLRIRRALPGDVGLYFDWANDVSVRTSALNQERIAWTTHATWFNNHLTNPSAFLFVAETNDLPVAQVRFEQQQDLFVIDFSVDAVFRNRRWASGIIHDAIQALPEHAPQLITAFVKPENLPSAKSLIGAGFNAHEDSHAQGLLRFDFDRS